jgi:hypothetical protein
VRGRRLDFIILFVLENHPHHRPKNDDDRRDACSREDDVCVKQMMEVQTMKKDSNGGGEGKDEDSFN